MKKSAGNKGASATEYAVLVGILSILALGGALATGGGVRDVFGVADARLSSEVRVAVGSEGVASQPVVPAPVEPEEPEEPEEPREGRPLMLTFTGTASFEMYRNSDSPLFPDPRIDWGPGGEACATEFPMLMENGVPYSEDWMRYWEYEDHVYSCNLGAGEHTVLVYAPVHTLTQFDSSLLRIDDWGDTEIRSLERAFERSAGLQSVPTSLPTSVWDMSFAFARPFTNYASSSPYYPVFTAAAVPVLPAMAQWSMANVREFNGMFIGQPAANIPSITHWNVGSGDRFDSMFAISTFNQDIGGWEMGNARSTSGMFWGNTAFNQNIGGWDMAQVYHTSSMFNRASAFNQDISRWDMLGVTVAQYMFANATSFNQDLSDWNVASLGLADYMFDGARAFAQDLSDWNVRSLAQGTGMFRNAPITGDYGKWRPAPGMRARGMWFDMFRNSRASGDLRCWDASQFGTTAPSNFSTNSLITYQPLWGKTPPSTCTP